MEYTKIITMIAETLEIKEDELNCEADLREMGIDSISFIRIVIALENNLDFEFDDENLTVERFNTLQDLINYVVSKSTESDTYIL